jgi:hypothetical protein
MDFLGMGLCVAFIAFVRLPSLKVRTWAFMDFISMRLIVAFKRLPSLKVRTHLTERSWTSSAWGSVSPSSPS